MGRAHGCLAVNPPTTVRCAGCQEVGLITENIIKRRLSCEQPILVHGRSFLTCVFEIMRAEVACCDFLHSGIERFSKKGLSAMSSLWLAKWPDGDIVLGRADDEEDFKAVRR